MKNIAIKNYILELTVFICGGLVMIYEIIGSRILSPFLGTSTYTWTSLIGVILAALSLGYWLGGKWADKKPDIKILALVIFFAAGLVSVTIFVKEIILAFVSQNSLPLELKSVLAALLLFAPASVFLGFVTPYAVKLKTTTLDETGKTVGRLYAHSTIGSIVGTFLAGFFLIPFVGSTRTLYLIAGVLMLLSIFLAPFSISRVKSAIITIFILGVAANEGQIYYQETSLNFYDIDTEYSRIQIFETEHQKSKRSIRAMAIDPYIYQSSMFLDTGEPASEYHKFYHLLRHFKPDFQKSLMIGGAGYSFPKEYLKAYPNAEMDVVEIDPQMTVLAKRFFNLKEDPRLKVFHQDGRVFLNYAESNKYDVVLLDAFSSLFSIPFQLTTLETVEQINRSLKDDGVVIFNIGTAISGNANKFLMAELKTYQKIFPHTYLFKVDSGKNTSKVQNVILIATKNTETNILRSNDPQITELLKHQYTIDIPTSTKVLTDDLAPVEYFNSFAQ